MQDASNPMVSLHSFDIATLQLHLGYFNCIFKVASVTCMTKECYQIGFLGS